MGQCASGAQNAFAFASAVQSGHMPDASTLAYQGVFNEHFFFAGEPAKATMEATAHPILRDGKPWLAIYLKSLLDGLPRDATPIDLSVVIDISGSMGCKMAYDEKAGARTRLDCAKRAVYWLVKEVLRADDRIALSTFNEAGHSIHGLTICGEMDKGKWLEECEKLTVSGGTTLSAGMLVGREAFGSDPLNGGKARQRRILFLTDMDEMGATELGMQIAKYANEDVFVSIVGMGVQFNAGLTETVTKNKGSIYSSATNDDELRQIIVDDFDFNSFPAAFDVNLSIRSGDLDVEKVYGTPFDHTDRADLTLSWSEERHNLYAPDTRAAVESIALKSLSAGAPLPPDCLSQVVEKLAPPRQTVTEVNTFFPGRITDGCIKGGLVLLQLCPKAGSAPMEASSLQLTLEYTDRAGVAHSQTDSTISFAAPYLCGSWVGANERTVQGLEKGMLLQHYCQICREHMELANQGGELTNVEEACARLKEAFGPVKAALNEESFVNHEPAMAQKLCANITDFEASFERHMGLSQNATTKSRGA